MAIINVIEAERVEKPNGFVQYFIIKDKTMEPVLENIQKTINLEKSNNYDFFNFICFRDEKGTYGFRELSQSQIKKSRVITSKELIAIRNVHKKRETWYEKAKNMNPWLGFLFFLLYTIILTINSYNYKVIFITKPTTSVWKLTFARSFLALLFTLIRTSGNI